MKAGDKLYCKKTISRNLWFKKVIFKFTPSRETVYMSSLGLKPNCVVFLIKDKEYTIINVLKEPLI